MRPSLMVLSPFFIATGISGRCGIRILLPRYVFLVEIPIKKKHPFKFSFKHMHCKEDKAELLKDLRTHIGELLHAETPEYFTNEWSFFSV